MTKSPRFVIWAVGAIVFLVVLNRFDQYYLKKNFLLKVNTGCNPASEQCFVSDCSAADPECDQSPYKKIEILAAQAPACLEEHQCQTFSCGGLSQCQVTYCSTGTMEEGERCVTTPSLAP